MLRDEADRLEKRVAEMREKDAEKSQDEGGRASEDETEESEEDDFVDILPEQIAKKQARGPRQSVSAEVFGVYNKKEAFVPKVIAKSDDVKNQINDKMSQAFMF